MLGQMKRGKVKFLWKCEMFPVVFLRSHHPAKVRGPAEDSSGLSLLPGKEVLLSGLAQ